MGIGDSIMASGAARKLHKSNGLPVVIVGRDGRPYWDSIWDDVPYILKRQSGKAVTRLMNCSGVRPYIAGKTALSWTWKPYKPTSAQIVFTPAELAFAEPYRGMIMIEPNVKAVGHDNKAWIADRWLALSATRTDFVQCVPNTSERCLPPNVLKVITPTFRHAAAVLSVCKAFIGTEGGLMHAAAAIGTPAVILWSEFISPEITGYHTDKIINLRHAGKPCGNRLACPSCRKSMEAIAVDEVVQSLEKLL